ncbi:HesB/YadR/YfhF family protein [Bacillus marasmi]|uniref:HesB/YadR/YfhF family protein n=1 Tax=Bacillus marasmi TaxID=1926279 RepID=UPI0011C6F61E|nr:HesB/YadR/YfhF family protein [Bacillus marasmi]
MKIHISHEAAQWYKNELQLKNGDNVRFYARYGGHSSVQQGFSLGLSTDVPMDIGVKEEIVGITFFIEDGDLWYFDEKDLYIDINQQFSEPEFRIS